MEVAAQTAGLGGGGTPGIGRGAAPLLRSAAMSSTGLADVVPEGARRVGIFGGTFDPPHNGHLTVAASARHALDLDVVLLVVAGEPWQKVGDRAISSAADRLAMVQQLCAHTDGVEACDLEVRRPGPSYTADSLGELAAPGRTLFLVLGRDAAGGLPTWSRVDEVRSLCVPVLVDRPGVEAPPLPVGWSWQRVEIPRLDVSSTELRGRVASGQPLDGLVPPGVITCIDERRLYGGRAPGAGARAARRGPR